MTEQDFLKAINKFYTIILRKKETLNRIARLKVPFLSLASNIKEKNLFLEVFTKIKKASQDIKNLKDSTTGEDISILVENSIQNTIDSDYNLETDPNNYKGYYEDLVGDCIMTAIGVIEDQIIIYVDYFEDYLF